MPINMGQMPMPGLPPHSQGDYASMLMQADQLQAQMTLAQLFQNNGMNQLAGLNPMMMPQNLMPQM